MALTLKSLTHHADIPEGALRVVPSRSGKSYLIVAANGQAIAETVPTQNPKKSMARAALLAHSLNVLPVVLAKACELEGLQGLQYAVKMAEDVSKIGV